MYLLNHSALLRLLYDSVSASNSNQHYQELIMKCTWKTLKYIPEWDKDLEYDKILIEVHRFLNVSRDKYDYHRSYRFVINLVDFSYRTTHRHGGKSNKMILL